jgi:hypothetical protein
LKKLLMSMIDQSFVKCGALLWCAFWWCGFNLVRIDAF